MKLRPYIFKKMVKAEKRLHSNPLDAVANADYKYWSEQLRLYTELVTMYKNEKLRKCRYCSSSVKYDDMESMGWLNRGN